MTSPSFRWLQTTDSNGTNNNSTGTEDSEPYHDARVLKDTMAVYGTAFVVVFVAFCWIRQRFPRPYTIRRWVEKYHTPLADDSFGYLS